MKPGDHILHKPSGETWVVAYADPEENTLSACGWPEGQVQLTDCELVKSVSQKESDDLIEQWLSGHSSNDHRARTIKRLYR